MILLGRGESGAVEMSATPSIRLRGELNDNIMMRQEQEPVWGNTLSPMLRWAAATDRLALGGDLAATFGRYRGEEGLDANGSSVSLTSEYQLERGRWGVDGIFLRDASWQSELRRSGRILAERRRSARTIDGFWEASLTQRLLIRGRYQLTDVRYAEEGGVLFDYQNRIGSIDVSYDHSERDRIIAAFHLLRYRSPAARVRSIDTGLRVGLRHLFSKTFRATVSIGGRGSISNLSLDEGEIKEHGRGLFGDLRVERDFESGRWTGGLSRRVDPSGSGHLLLSDHLFLNIAREITETVTLSLAVDGYQNRALRSTLPETKSHIFIIEPAWRWRWTEEWSMAVSYRYTRQRDGGRAADANAAVWMFVYKGPTWVGSLEGMSSETRDEH